MAIFVAIYDYAPGSADTRDEHRAAHRDWLAARPNLLASGPTAGAGDGAILVFEGSSAAEIETLLDDDPFAAVGVIAARRVARWDIVLGSWREPLGLL